MNKLRSLVEQKMADHNMHVHVTPAGKNKFTVKSVGSGVGEYLKKGDTVSSSDLDDLSDSGHKVKEIK